MQKGFVSIFIIFLLIIILIIGVGVYLLGTKKNPIIPQQPQGINTSSTPPTSQNNTDNDFFFFSVPKPIARLSLEDLPNFEDIRDAVVYGDKLWLSGDGSLIEYDPSSQKITRYSNPRKANCDSNIVIVENFLFAACRLGAVNDIYEPSYEYPPYGVYKINLLNYSVDHIFTKTDGLLNTDNYELTADGATVWVNTFEGVGKINAKTNELKFYTSELGLQDNHVNITNIGDEYVWVAGKGEMALFSKKSQQWQGFPPEVVSGIKGSNTIFGFKEIQGGTQTGLFTYTDRNCLLREYKYNLQQWVTINSRSIYYVHECEAWLKTYLPLFKKTITSITSTNQDSLTQLNLPTSSGGTDKYIINGRANLYLSPVIEDKRYILTSSTIDIIDETLNLPVIAIKLGSNIVSSIPRIIPGTRTLLIDPGSMLGIVMDAGCTPQPACLDQKMWLVDLKSRKVLRVYTPEVFPDSYSLDQLLLTKQQDTLLIKDKNGKTLFNIDTTNYNLTNLSK